MSTLVEPKVQAAGRVSQYRLYSKGASEIIIERCTHFLDDNGQVQEMNPNKREVILGLISEWAQNGLRTFALGYKDVSDLSSFMSVSETDPETDLTFIALVGIKDPLRKGVAEAVLDCKRAGLTVRMVTGDNIQTGMVYSNVVFSD